MVRSGALLGAVLTLACAAAARADDFAATARDMIPSGQFGGLPVPAGAATQAGCTTP